MTPPHPSSLAPSTGESHCPARRPPSLRCILLLFPEPLFAVSSARLIPRHPSPAAGLAPMSVPLGPSGQQLVLASTALCHLGVADGSSKERWTRGSVWASPVDRSLTE